MNDYKGINNFDELIELEHGRTGTDSRNEFEETEQMFIVSEFCLPNLGSPVVFCTFVE
jgi:hypothetical protein